MIHFRGEGCPYQTGLNIGLGTWKHPWISLSWVSVNLLKRWAKVYYFRIRLYKYPFFIFDKNEWDIVDSWLRDQGYIPVTKEFVADALSLSNYKPWELYNKYAYTSFPIDDNQS